MKQVASKISKTWVWLTFFTCMVLAGFSLFVAIGEANSVITSNSKNLKIQHMQPGDLAYSYSAYSRNAVLVDCFEAMNSILARVSAEERNQIRRDECARLARSILDKNPGMSLAWVILADHQFTNGDHDEAIISLNRSGDLGKNESWLARTRVITALKFLDSASLSANSVFQSDVILLLGSRDDSYWLALNWKKHEPIREVIEMALNKVVPQQQNRFLGHLRRMQQS